MTAQSTALVDADSDCRCCHTQSYGTLIDLQQTFLMDVVPLLTLSGRAHFFTDASQTQAVGHQLKTCQVINFRSGPFLGRRARSPPKRAECGGVNWVQAWMHSSCYPVGLNPICLWSELTVVSLTFITNQPPSLDPAIKSCYTLLYEGGTKLRKKWLETEGNSTVMTSTWFRQVTLKPFAGTFPFWFANLLVGSESNQWSRRAGKGDIFFLSPQRNDIEKRCGPCRHLIFSYMLFPYCLVNGETRWSP